VRECAARLVQFAKQTGCAVVLVGHVTKEGALAGPRVLEHMVDAVLYFESDSGSRYRLVRAIKNRFGAANELGVFAMTDAGLKAVSNPSAIFLTGQDDPAPGSCVLVTREGTRPLMVEVQALVAPSSLSNPRRVAVGIDPNRLGMLLAVMNRHVGIAIGDQDVFVNVAGGMRVGETASDLAVALALKSSLAEKPLPRGLVAFGEVGLAGELRPVQNGEDRLREAAGQGFDRALVPEANLKGVKARLRARGCRRLSDALAAAWE
jgi:DNA repair protein RadA/Sms